MTGEKTYLETLSINQREAVLYNEGPSLIVAGAGSGKTRVLTYKIVGLLEEGYAPQQILALTFTNKAAREMKSRIGSIIGESMVKRLWMGTFHSVFYRILRNEAERVGYRSDFTIYDMADTKNLLRTIIKEMQLDDKQYQPKLIQSRISQAKNSLITSLAYESNRELVAYDNKLRIPFLREVYKQYQLRCFQAGVMDFDDLLLQTNILFRDHADILEKYQNWFRFVLVDEYQDTNFAQHLIVTRLCEVHHRICVVGDDAQSIYSFRGANIDNMLRFRDNYPECRIFKLEQNYRSTQNIVNAANSLIRKNKGQIPKKVFSKNEEGHKIQVHSSYSDYEEAYVIASEIASLRIAESCSYTSFAILYRTNAQSRIIEEALRKRNIPYRVYGGQSFYQRKEVKDLVAYFRVVVNPHDEEAMKRIINYPARGIGNTTLDKLLTAATFNQISLWQVLQKPDTYAASFHAGTLKKLHAFADLIQEFVSQNSLLPAEALAELIVRKSGLAAVLYDDGSIEGISRQENFQEVLKAVAEFAAIKREEGVEQVALSDFLVEVSLITDQDTDNDETAERVTLLTAHAAKGLEFDYVCIAGLEENLFPSCMATQTVQGVEEERRLFYVAITRARKRCFITYAKSRFRNGQTNNCVPSHFLTDIDKRYMNLPAELEQKPAQTLQPKYDSDNLIRENERETKRRPQLKKLPPSVFAEKKEHLQGFKVGDKVSHSRFGQGEILSLGGVGGDARALISFEHLGIKSLLLKYAKLTLL